jgi:glycosyltransferase involved in cell wall biosynthesis
MAVHNGELYLRQAIDSILDQTFRNFEFIIINDGSTDSTADILDSYRDSRVSVISNSENLGLTASLNMGLDAASGEYIARMDCDDISLSERLDKQVAFMDQSPKIAASGTWARDIDGTGKVLGNRCLGVGSRMTYDYWWPTPIIHPSAIIRKSLLRNHRYDPSIRYAQDYDLWLRLRKESALDNLPEYLLLYRVHRESISDTQAEPQLRSVYQSFCNHTGLTLTYDSFLNLIGVNRTLNPIWRVLLRGRVARAVHKPYSRYLIDELWLATHWLGIVLRLDEVKNWVLQNLYSVWLRIRPDDKMTPRNRGVGDR